MRRYIFCATVLRVAPTGSYPAHCPAEFGLSSLHLRALRRFGGRRSSGSLRSSVIVGYPSDSCEIWYCSSFLYRLLRGVSITSAVFEMFQPLSRSLATRNARSALSLNSRSVPALVSPAAAERVAGLRRRGRRPPAAIRTLSGRSRHVDGVAAGHDDHALDRVPQLADVALPAIPLQRLERGRRDALRPLVVLAAEMLHEVPHEQRDVFGTFAQRRHVDRNHGEPEVQVLAEVALLDFFLEVLVRRGDHADVDLDRARRSEALDFALLQHAQHLGLRLRRSCRRFRRGRSCPCRPARTCRPAFRWRR